MNEPLSFHREGRPRYILFFFQAEDGIRDTSVTRVQTCALPISFTFRTLEESRRSIKIKNLLRQRPGIVKTLVFAETSSAEKMDKRSTGEKRVLIFIF